MCLLNAVNRCDLDAIAEDARLDTPRGSPSWFVGTLRCARAWPVASRTGLPDVHYGNARDFVSGHTAFSEWTVTGTRPTGKRVEAHGTHHWELRDGKVVRKDSYGKIVKQ